MYLRSSLVQLRQCCHAPVGSGGNTDRFDALTSTFFFLSLSLNRLQGPGVLICSIDNMPTQLPMEATDFFGELLLPYVRTILKSDATKVRRRGRGGAGRNASFFSFKEEFVVEQKILVFFF